MRTVALSLIVLWTLTLAGCQSKAAKVKQLQGQYNAEYPAYAKACLEEDSAAAKRLMTGEKLTAEQTAAIEAEQKHERRGASQNLTVLHRYREKFLLHSSRAVPL